jgi:hypothetical protein
MNAHGEHAFENFEGRDDMRDAGFHGPVGEPGVSILARTAMVRS